MSRSARLRICESRLRATVPLTETRDWLRAAAAERHFHRTAPPAWFSQSYHAGKGRIRAAARGAWPSVAKPLPRGSPFSPGVSRCR